jgi:predicted ArsR family transcriptional regulator
VGALDRLLDRGLSDALLFVRGRPRPVTADELAAAHGVHRNVARSRLERLAGAGLLVPDFERRTGRSGPGAGRPAKTYAAAPELTALELPRRRYEELFSLLVDALPSRKRLREIGIAYGRTFGRGLRASKTLPTALANACAALRRAGFQASVVEAGDEEGLISTPTCPLRPLVRTSARGRELDRGLWEGLIARLLSSGAAVACETSRCHDNAEPCLVRVRAVNTIQRS